MHVNFSIDGVLDTLDIGEMLESCFNGSFYLHLCCRCSIKIFQSFRLKIYDRHTITNGDSEVIFSKSRKRIECMCAFLLFGWRWRIEESLECRIGNSRGLGNNSRNGKGCFVCKLLNIILAVEKDGESAGSDGMFYNKNLLAACLSRLQTINHFSHLSTCYWRIGKPVRRKHVVPQKSIHISLPPCSTSISVNMIPPIPTFITFIHRNVKGLHKNFCGFGKINWMRWEKRSTKSVLWRESGQHGIGHAITTDNMLLNRFLYVRCKPFASVYIFKDGFSRDMN